MELSERSTARAARAAWGLSAVLAVGNAVITALASSRLGALGAGERFFDWLSVFAGVLYASMGLLIVIRARNRIGWFLMSIGALMELSTISNVYPVAGLLAHPGSLPAPKVVAASLHGVYPVLMVSLTLMLLVYPTGSPPSRRWRRVIWVEVVGVAVAFVGLAVVPPVLTVGGKAPFPNPFAIGGALHAVMANALVVASWVTVSAGAACLVGLVVRFRRGNAELRQQVKWLVLASAGALACFLFAIGSLIACGCDDSAVGNIGFLGFFVFVTVALPAAIAIAVLKYRLYEIDVILSKAVLYSLLAAFFTAVYLAIVIGVGATLGSRGNSALTIAAALVIAVAFQPVRDRARRLADRVVYGKRATPYEVLSEFSDRVAGAYASDDVLPRMAQILAAGTGAVAARVWLRFGNELRETASSPSDGAVAPVEVADDHPGGFPPREHGVEVRHQGELLGALSVETSPSDPMNPAKEKLVRDLASQAGLVLRNVRLIEELRASRRRIVTAQDERAKALERNLHDGAQQQLVALGIQLGLAQRLASDTAPDVAELLEGLRTQANDALENLRDLARGIYPPLLADKGLASALDAQARKGAVPTTVETDGVRRYPQEVETAVYFCVLEALNNVAKYARATSARVRLTDDGGTLLFEVEDDGSGFDTTQTAYGTGLQGMADRLDAIGGTLEVTSAPGQGTTVTGAVRIQF